MSILKIKEPKCIELLVDLAYGHLTPTEAVELEEALNSLDETTAKKLILVRTHNVCEKLFKNELLQKG